MKNIFFTALLLYCLISCRAQENICFPSGKKYLIITPEGGLANRLRSLASANIMAKASGRILVVDWQQDYNMPAQFEALFESKLLHPSELILSGSCENNHKHYQGDSARVIEELISKIPTDTAPIIHISTCHNFYPESMSFYEFLKQYKEFYKELRPIQSIKSKIEARSANFNPKNAHIGVHYRAWKTSVDLGYGLQGAPLLFFEHAIDKWKLSGDSIFFASDSEDAKKHFEAHYKNIIFSNASNMDRTSLQAVQDALVDWYLLTKSRSIIGTFESSFSDEAAMLTLTGKKFNVGPAQMPFHSIICFDSKGDPYQKPKGRGC